MTPEIILGPPGTGKTTTLLNIVEQEMERGTPPDRVAFLSFTRRAADEAADRACKKFNLSRSQLPYFRTIHSLVFHQLGLRRSEVLEGTKLKEFSAWMGIRITGKFSEDGTLYGLADGDKILFMEGLSRVKGVPLQTLYKNSGENIPWSEVDRVARGLQIFKQEENLLDFTDFLDIFIARGNCPKLELLLLDEVQDQSEKQWQVIEKLSKNAKRTILSGDDDQAVFAYAGASVQRLVTQPGTVSVLGQSYRVPILVQNLANHVISRVKNRRPKEWNPRDEQGKIDRAKNFADVNLSGDDVLVLARNSYLLYKQVEPHLRKMGIIYSRNGIPSVKESMLRAIVDWERLRGGEPIPLYAAQNIYDYLASGIGVAKGFKKLQTFNSDAIVSIGDLQERGGLLVDPSLIWHVALTRIPENDKSYIIAARKHGQKLLGKSKVQISTIHSSKGGQANRVVLFSEMAQRSYKEMERDSDSEARVFYTGVTRTREYLTIVESSNQYFYPNI